MDEGGIAHLALGNRRIRIPHKAQLCPLRDEGEVSSLPLQYPSSNDDEDAPQIVPLHLPDPIMGGLLAADPGEKRGPVSDAEFL